MNRLSASLLDNYASNSGNNDTRPKGNERVPKIETEHIQPEEYGQ